jgi:DNA polymerase III delta prime subunit
MQVSDQPLISEVFFNREAEAARLLAAIKERQSLLISGPAGIGKTRLVLEVLKDLRRDQHKSCIYLSAVAGLRGTLSRLLRNLNAAEDPTLRRQMRADGFRSSDFKAWLKAQPSSRLKGTLYRAVEKRSYWIFLDQVSVITPPVAKLIIELVRMRDTPVYLLTRSLKGRTANLLLNLYWSNEHRLPLAPLPETAARSLVESCIESFALSHLDLSTFRREVLRLSGRVPGAIVQMCARAADPRYQYGLRPKTTLLHLDSLVRGYREPPRAERGRERLSP